jgi:hypothetical protein
MSDSVFYLIFVSLFLFGSSGYHFFANARCIDEFLGRERNIRIIGMFLLVVGAAGILLKGRTSEIIGVFFFLSGFWRFFFPKSSITFQKKAYPRWVHGIIMSIAGILILLLAVT